MLMKKKRTNHLLVLIDSMYGHWIVGPLQDMSASRNRHEKSQRVKRFTQALCLLVAYPDLVAAIKSVIKDTTDLHEQENKFFVTITKFLEERDLKDNFSS